MEVADCLGRSGSRADYGPRRFAAGPSPEHVLRPRLHRPIPRTLGTSRGPGGTRLMPLPGEAPEIAVVAEPPHRVRFATQVAEPVEEIAWRARYRRPPAIAGSAFRSGVDVFGGRRTGTMRCSRRWRSRPRHRWTAIVGSASGVADAHRSDLALPPAGPTKRLHELRPEARIVARPRGFGHRLEPPSRFGEVPSLLPEPPHRERQRNRDRRVGRGDCPVQHGTNVIVI